MTPSELYKKNLRGSLKAEVVAGKLWERNGYEVSVEKTRGYQENVYGDSGYDLKIRNKKNEDGEWVKVEVTHRKNLGNWTDAESYPFETVLFKSVKRMLGAPDRGAIGVVLNQDMTHLAVFSIPEGPTEKDFLDAGWMVETRINKSVDPDKPVAQFAVPVGMVSFAEITL